MLHVEAFHQYLAALFPSSLPVALPSAILAAVCGGVQGFLSQHIKPYIAHNDSECAGNMRSYCRYEMLFASQTLPGVPHPSCIVHW